MFLNGKKSDAKRYSSGELKFLKPQLMSYVKNNKVEIMFCGNSFLELLIVLDFYKQQKVETTLVLPYLPYQRMDHSEDDELDSVTSIANVLNKFNLKKIIICEPHCNIKIFKKGSRFSIVEKIKKDVFKEIGFNPKIDNLVLPDNGAYTKYKHLAANVIYFEKKRDKKTGLIISHDMIGNIDPTKKTIIVDDIISTGDTICNILDKLKTCGIKNVAILSGHFEDNVYNHRLLKNKMVTKIFSSNSLQKNESKKLKLYTIWGLFYGK